MQKIVRESGIDTMTAEISIILTKAIGIVGKQELKDDYGKLLGDMEIKKGKIILTVNLPRAIGRSDNIKPVSMIDAIKISLISVNLMKSLETVLGVKSEEIKTMVKTIEMNVTTDVDKNTTPDAIVRMFESAYAHTSQQNKTYSHSEIDVEFGPCRARKKVDNGFLSYKLRTHKGGRYRIKVYDKTFEQWAKTHKAMNKELPAENQRLIRVEIVMLEDLLKNLFKEKEISVQEILNAKSLTILCDEYKRIYCDEIVEDHIKPYLTSTVYDVLVPTLIKTDKYVDTYAKCKEYIFDASQMKRALKKYYEIKKANGELKSNDIYIVKKSVNRAMKYLDDRFKINSLDGTFKTLKDIKNKA